MGFSRGFPCLFPSESVQRISHGRQREASALDLSVSVLDIMAAHHLPSSTSTSSCPQASDLACLRTTHHGSYPALLSALHTLAAPSLHRTPSSIINLRKYAVRHSSGITLVPSLPQHPTTPPFLLDNTTDWDEQHWHRREELVVKVKANHWRLHSSRSVWNDRVIPMRNSHKPRQSAADHEYLWCFLLDPRPRHECVRYRMRDGCCSSRECIR